MQEESRELLKRCTEIVKYRRLQRNANAAIQQISMCLPMLESYGQLEKLMEQKKYVCQYQGVGNSKTGHRNLHFLIKVYNLR